MVMPVTPEWQSVQQAGSPWQQLMQELDAWGESGRLATLWWRDDDSGALGPALTRLLDLHQETMVPLSLAVVPAWATPEFGQLLLRYYDRIDCLVHGYAHVNHAVPGAKKSEFPPERSLDAMSADIEAGLSKLTNLLENRLRPIFVPPWNRMTPALLPRMAQGGFRGVSAYRNQVVGNDNMAGLKVVNCHVDPIDWRQRRFLGTATAIENLCQHLRARRQGRADVNEVTGVLTHHRVHDEETWLFIARLLRCTIDHPAACWVGVEAAMEGEPDSKGFSR